MKSRLSGVVAVIDCGELPPPKNGAVTFFPDVLGTQARFSCFRDYRLEGNPIRFCQADGEWSGTQPICVGKH